MRILKINIFFIFLFIVLNLCHAFDTTYYCGNLSYIKKKDIDIIKIITNISQKKNITCPYLKTELYNSEQRIDFCCYGSSKSLDEFLKNIKEKIPLGSINKIKINKSKSLNNILCPSTICKRNNNKKNKKISSFPWENELNREEKKIKKLEDIKITNKYESKNEKLSIITNKTNIFYEKYLFVDGIIAKGFKEYNECRKKGKEIYNRLGLRFAWQINNNLSLWGDFLFGFAYQNFKKTIRRRGWGGLNYFYLSTKSIYEPNFSGYDISIGRVPIIEKKGFWYYNFLDGIKIKYQSTLLKWSLFVGKRFEDYRISNSEERINLQGYNYLIGELNYQYYYKHHISFFYIKEYKKDFSNINNISIWKGVRNKENLNWLGLRATGSSIKKRNKWEKYYWLDIGYMWGERGFNSSIFKGCSAYKKIKSIYYKSVNGFGIDVGGKVVKGNIGLGIRIAIGQGNHNNKGSKSFYLPKLSSERDTLFSINRVRYYGELTNPELNNLYIFSFFSGYQFFQDNWIELNILKYNQYKNSKNLEFSKYFSSPNGRDNDLGWEMDIHIDGSIKTYSNKWKYILTGSIFIPGEAFNGTVDIKKAYGVFFRIKRYW